MATVNTGLFRMSLVDWDHQRRQFSFDAPVITAANHDAVKGTHDALVAAIQAVTLGNDVFNELVADREYEDPVAAAFDTPAQVNIQWVFTYQDAVTTQEINVRIPTADITDSTLFAAGTNEWDPTDAKWVTLKAAFEAHVLSPAGNAVTLTKVVYLQ
jgi:hypothetical protein